MTDDSPQPKKLFDLTPEQRAQVEKVYPGPGEADIFEQHANQKAHDELFRLADILELAIRHPDVPNAKRILDAVRKIIHDPES